MASTLTKRHKVASTRLIAPCSVLLLTLAASNAQAQNQPNGNGGPTGSYNGTDLVTWDWSGSATLSSEGTGTGTPSINPGPETIEIQSDAGASGNGDRITDGAVAQGSADTVKTIDWFWEGDQNSAPSVDVGYAFIGNIIGTTAADGDGLSDFKVAYTGYVHTLGYRSASLGFLSAEDITGDAVGPGAEYTNKGGDWAYQRDRVSNTFTTNLSLSAWYWVGAWARDSSSSAHADVFTVARFDLALLNPQFPDPTPDEDPDPDEE